MKHFWRLGHDHAGVFQMEQTESVQSQYWWVAKDQLSEFAFYKVFTSVKETGIKRRLSSTSCNCTKAPQTPLAFRVFYISV